MPYTLAKWALWLVVAAAVGLIVGYLLGRLSRAQMLGDDDGHVGHPSAGNEPAPVSSVATAQRSDTEVDRLRRKLAELESVAIERDSLVWELAELRKASTNAAPAELVFEPVDTGESAVVAALTAERDQLAARASALEQVVSELRVRVWNAEAQANEARQLAASQAAAASASHADPGAMLPRVRGLSAPVRPVPPPPPPPPDVSAGELVLGAPLRFDDLTAIEGIGSQIAQLCAARGIGSWWAMANTDVDRLRRMLASAGPRFQVHDPDSWPEQARLLSYGRWAEFAALTRSLRASRSE